MWPFDRNQAKVKAATNAIPSAIEDAKEGWLYFVKTMPFRAEVPLKERIVAYSMPGVERIRARFPELKKLGDGMLMIIISNGIVLSGTHTRAEIEEAFGSTLPDWTKGRNNNG